MSTTTLTLSGSIQAQISLVKLPHKTFPGAVNITGVFSYILSVSTPWVKQLFNIN